MIRQTNAFWLRTTLFMKQKQTNKLYVQRCRINCDINSQRILRSAFAHVVWSFVTIWLVFLLTGFEHFCHSHSRHRRIFNHMPYTLNLCWKSICHKIEPIGIFCARSEPMRYHECTHRTIVDRIENIRLNSKTSKHQINPSGDLCRPEPKKCKNCIDCRHIDVYTFAAILSILFVCQISIAVQPKEITRFGLQRTLSYSFASFRCLFSR